MKSAFVVAVVLGCALSGCCIGTSKTPGCFDIQVEGLGQGKPQRDVPVGVDGPHTQPPQSRGAIIRWIVWMSI